LSSNNPNLQNIPIRTEMGQKIRTAFVAELDHLLLSADYSQIELRVLAHLSGDEKLLNAFLIDEDIHVSTASDIFGMNKASITPEMRRRAKAVNFGIIYGMSPFGLARDVGISQTEAKEFIDNYFATYPVVSRFLSQIKSEAKHKGFISTLLKRRRYIHDLESRNKNKRQLAERTAINSVIQGSAADIIKVAMVKVHKSMGNQGVSSQMLLQVHDELVFEVPKDELSQMKSLVRNCMENVLDLQVPLKVDIHSGANWAALK
jgi:DNA polymerase-1